jgi:hypothetical protein
LSFVAVGLGLTMVGFGLLIFNNDEKCVFFKKNLDQKCDRKGQSTSDGHTIFKMEFGKM